MNGNLRWGTPAHTRGCDHLWGDWKNAKETPLGYLRWDGPIAVRWCLFCATVEYQ
jgi:hypothetical protein